jgi:ATP:ADP antiporter, AAA family
MASPSSRRPSPPVVAMFSAAAVSGQFIAGKATRDALFLSYLDVTLLPMIVIATSVFSILLVAIGSRMLVRFTPVVFVPLAFAANAVFLLAAWLVIPLAPAVAACAVYLEISGLGPMLGSGFWLIASERFDPHTARQQFGQITGLGTLGGLVGALVAERVGALYGISAMLPLLAVVNMICAWQVRQLAMSAHRVPTRHGMEDAPELAAESPASGLRVLAHTAYLRNLAAVVMLGTAAAALADYAFKVQAVGVFGRGDELLRFFAIYYAATSLLSFVVQSVTGAVALQRLGLALTTSTPSLALLLGSIGAIVAPGLQGALVARGAESVFRGSLFRTGYEIFYTPVPAAEKRAAKSIIDVGFDRLGDAFGGGLVRLFLLLPAARQYSTILVGAIACSAAALIVARRLNRGYIETLERNLLNRAVELDLSEVEELTTRTVMLRTLRPSGSFDGHETASISRAIRSDTLQATDPEMREILALRSRDRDRVAAVLRDEEGLPATLIAHAIPLLAWDPIAEDAVRALRRVAEEHVGQLTDALIDPNQPFAVRRRLARVFSVCVSQRAVDGLLLGLEDLRFEVRFQCGRSLAAVASKNRLIRIDERRVFDAVRREVAVGRPVWESQRLLDQGDQQDQASFVDEFVKDRAGQSLAHVFTLLSLVLPTAPLQISYRGLHTDDPGLRGTALEYLEGVLPADIRERLWPFVGGTPEGVRPSRSREDILEELLRSNESIMLNLEELRRQARATRRPDAAARV